MMDDDVPLVIYDVEGDSNNEDILGIITPIDIVVGEQIEPIIQAWRSTIDKDPRNLAIVTYEISDEVCNQLLVINRKMAKFNVGVFVVKPRLTAEINSGLQVVRDIASFCGIPSEGSYVGSARAGHPCPHYCR